MKLKIFSSALVALLIPGVVSAAPVIDVNFSNMTAGQQVVVQTPVSGSLPVTKADFIAATNNTTINVVNNFVSSGSSVPFGSGHVMVYDRPTNSTGNSSQVNFELHPSDKLTTGIVSHKFDLMIDDNLAQNGNFFIGLRDANWNAISSLSLGSNKVLTLYGYDTAGHADGTSSALGTLSVATSYNVEMRLDFGTGTSQTYLNGSAVGSALSFSGTNGTIGIVFSTSTATVGRWAVDNITMEAIPEPSIAALTLSALVGGALMIRRRRSTDRHE